MDIVGIGIDATEIRRIADAIERWGDRFVGRVFTDGEIAYCRAKRDFASSFAARFAAKEAAMKVLRPSRDDAVPWNTIAVRRDEAGAVAVELSGRAAELDAAPAGI